MREKVTGIGKLGHYVYYKRKYNNKTKYIKRLYVRPLQPGTFKQKIRWIIFKGAVRFWQALPVEVKEELDKKAAPARISGFNYTISKILRSFI